MFTFAIDFDGTCVHHAFPKIGEVVPHAVETLLALQKDHRLILWTCRTGHYLQDAVAFMKHHGVEFFSHNDNPTQKHWSPGPKIYAHEYIDDAALGCPLIHPPEGGRGYVDWLTIRRLLNAKYGFAL